MEVVTTVEGFVPFPREAVWGVLVDVNGLQHVLRPVFPIPGVLRAEVEGGGALAVGTTRLVHLSDGSVGREGILALDAPSRHTYDLTGLKPPFGWMVRRGVADWRFSEVDGGTRVEWTYTFTLTTPLAWPLAQLVLVLFRRFMR